jgi:hypothetical protein
MTATNMTAANSHPPKSTRILQSVLLAALALAATTALAQTDAQKAFNALKAMPGSWEGKNLQGEPLQVSYKLTSGGSAVMSDIIAHGSDMPTIFHLDGPDKLLMTHYCTAGNQPRMQASVSPDGKIITFNFVDATNLASPDAGHMQRMVLTLVDDNHHTEEWIFVSHGQETKQFFDLRRKS